MKQRRRIYYSESQKALMWERWRMGESIQHIASYSIAIIRRYREFWRKLEEFSLRHGDDRGGRSRLPSARRFREVSSRAIRFSQ